MKKETKKTLLWVALFLAALITILMILPSCSTSRGLPCPQNDKKYFYKEQGTKPFKIRKSI
jgi:hypothetical protein